MTSHWRWWVEKGFHFEGPTFRNHTRWWDYSGSWWWGWSRDPAHEVKLIGSYHKKKWLVAYANSKNKNKTKQENCKFNPKLQTPDFQTSCPHCWSHNLRWDCSWHHQPWKMSKVPGVFLAFGVNLLSSTERIFIDLNIFTGTLDTSLN